MFGDDRSSGRKLLSKTADFDNLAARIISIEKNVGAAYAQSTLNSEVAIWL